MASNVGSFGPEPNSVSKLEAQAKDLAFMGVKASGKMSASRQKQTSIDSATR